MRQTSFAELLSAAMESAGIGVREFARQTNLSSGRISDFRKGRLVPDAAKADLFGQILKIHPQDLDAWKQAAAIDRARNSSTGKAGSTIYEQRISELENKLSTAEMVGRTYSLKVMHSDEAHLDSCRKKFYEAMDLLKSAMNQSVSLR